MAFRLRRAEAADAEALSLVAGATFLETYADILKREDMLAHIAGKSSPERFSSFIADPRTIVTLAEAPAGRAPLGYTIMADPDLPVELQADDIELLRIYTLAPRLGSGLGAALLERAVTDARADGRQRILLGTHPDNVRARRFYEKNGFSIIGRRTFRVGEAEFDDPVYARPL